MEKTETVHALILFFGYVESASVSCLIARHEQGFESVEAALKDFATAIIDANKEELQKEFVLDQLDQEDAQEEAEEWFWNLMKGDNDSTNTEWEHLSKHGWSIGSFETNIFSKGVFVVTETAETFLWAAYAGKLGNSKDDPEKSDEYLFQHPLQDYVKKIC